MKVSVVIRTLNEAQKLQRLLSALHSQQTSHEVELIVVDNESIDGTQEVAKKSGAHLLTIKEFTYPRSMNIGCEAATGEVIILTVGHAVPFHNTWIDDGVRHFKNDKTAGVYGHTWYDEGASLVEKIMYGATYYWMKLFGISRVKKADMGVLGATNCAIRQTLWKQNPFDETFERGGEDTAWAGWAIQQGYDIIRDQAFAVRHSHGASLKTMIRQLMYWGSLGPNQKFDRNELLSFREDLKDRMK